MRTIGVVVSPPLGRKPTCFAIETGHQMSEPQPITAIRIFLLRASGATLTESPLLDDVAHPRRDKGQQRSRWQIKRFLTANALLAGVRSDFRGKSWPDQEPNWLSMKSIVMFSAMTSCGMSAYRHGLPPYVRACSLAQAHH